MHPVVERRETILIKHKIFFIFLALLSERLYAAMGLLYGVLPEDG
jgi:hypothetical protein